MNKNIILVSPCCRVKVTVEPKKDLVDMTGKTFYFVCPKCNHACNPITEEDSKCLAMHISTPNTKDEEKEEER